MNKFLLNNHFRRLENINNNSIVRIYRGVRGGGFNNNAFYSGIDFCDYDMPIKTQNRNNYK